MLLSFVWTSLTLLAGWVYLRLIVFTLYYIVDILISLKV